MKLCKRFSAVLQRERAQWLNLLNLLKGMKEKVLSEKEKKRRKGKRSAVGRTGLEVYF